MLFSRRDIELMMLLRWCRYIHSAELSKLFDEAELKNLSMLRYIKLHTSGAYVLTAKGHALLDSVSENLPPATPPSYRPADIERRLHLSQIFMTAYRAGVNVFTLNPYAIADAPAMFIPAIVRGRGSNPWGSTRIAALLNSGTAVYAIHYVKPDIGKIALTDELTAFSNNTAHLRNTNRGFIFAGDSYESVLKEIRKSQKYESDSRLVSYGEAYRSLQLPLHLLSCDETGATQLRMMSVPDYRSWFSKAALRSSYQPPPKECPSWDAIYSGQPFVMAADMDLRRIDAAIATAEKMNTGMPVLTALDSQAKALLYELYRNTGKARVFTLTESVLDGLELYYPPREQFITEEGGTVDVPLIQTNRKA